MTPAPVGQHNPNKPRSAHLELSSQVANGKWRNEEDEEDDDDFCGITTFGVFVDVDVDIDVDVVLDNISDLPPLRS